ncbi:MAG: acyl-CoA thioesterase [Crocinitomicaceae bacterium]|nr:acyl-CoA thioesterase [Crocinitomicaceae bacterium]
MKIEYSHETILRVRYSETDQMGYCYYGNYAQYFEVGRVELLRSMGISYKTLEIQGIMLPVSSLSIKYKAPAKYDDALKIITNITELKGARLNFDYTIFNEDGQLLATAETGLVFVNKETMRPTSAPDNFTSLISKHEIQSK